MSLALSMTRSSIGIYAKPVSVEVHLSNGLPQFTIVGLAETAVKESKDRVRSAIINSQFEFPCRRITVNLAPADLPKAGSGFDLAIALGILAASGQIPGTALLNHEFSGELALDGQIRRIGAVIPAVLAGYHAKNTILIPASNAHEAGLVGYDKVYGVKDLREVCAYLCQQHTLTPIPISQGSLGETREDWSEVKGQMQAKNALVVAAAGGHSALLCGAPGSGKTMLAKRFITLLPLLSEEQALECAAIYSIQNKPINYESWRSPPFRSPHHTASQAALVGGSNPPKPGEISLAHHGVLFLDELPEFSRHVLETLREPLEAGSIAISRAAQQIEFPAKFQLIAAMNPCPCGHWGNPQAECYCSPDRVKRYLGKLSAPFLDRIDLQVSIQPLSKEELLAPAPACVQDFVALKERIARVRTHQYQRQGCLNTNLGTRSCEEWCFLQDKERQFLLQIMNKLNLSARGYHRLLKVARTIADLKEQTEVDIDCLKQALSYRQTIQMPK